MCEVSVNNQDWIMKNLKERLLTKDYVFVMCSSVGISFMNFFFAPTLALYIIDIHGGTAAQVGILSLVYSLSALILRPISGVLSDKFGRVKLLIVGAATCTVMTVLFGLAGAIATLMFIRAIQGIGFALHSTCAGAVAGDVLPKSRLAEGIGIFGLGATVAQAFGPMIALAIVRSRDAYGNSVVGTLADFRMLFFIMAAMCLLSTIANCCITYERKRKKQAAQADIDVWAEEQMSESMSLPMDAPAEAAESEEPLPKTILGFEYAVFAPVIVLVFTFIATSGIALFLVPFAEIKGFGNVAGVYFLISALGVFISRMIFGRIADKRGNDIIIIPSLALLAIGLLVLPLIRSETEFLLLAFLSGLAQGAAMPTFNSLIFKRCSAARRGTASGAYFMPIDIGFMVGPLMFGIISDVFDPRYIFWGSGISVTLALALYILISSDKRYNAMLKRKKLPMQ